MKLKHCAKLIDKVHEQLDIVDEESKFNKKAKKAFLEATKLLNKLSRCLLDVDKKKCYPIKKWSRKGECPVCGVQTGSYHSVYCDWYAKNKSTLKD